MVISRTDPVLQGWDDIDSDRAAKKLSADYQSVCRWSGLSCRSTVSAITPRSGLPTISQQDSELTKGFVFWPSPDKRVGGNVYDIR